MKYSEYQRLISSPCAATAAGSSCISLISDSGTRPALSLTWAWTDRSGGVPDADDTAGALLALKYTESTLNVYSQIGLITLVGLITKHGILIVEFANQLRAGGMSALDAVHRSATLRLRPILMTTGAMVLGAIPLALATGAGSESRRQIGWVIVGGMSLGTLLTIFVVPTMYSLLARKATPGPNMTVVDDTPPSHA